MAPACSRLAMSRRSFSRHGDTATGLQPSPSSGGGGVRIRSSGETDNLDDFVRLNQVPLNVRTAGAGGALRRILQRVTNVEGYRNFPGVRRRSLQGDFTDGKRASGEGRKVLAQLFGNECLFFRPITVVVDFGIEAP